MEFEAVIGLEVHAQLGTRSKLFCGCRVEAGAPPNTRICPVCLGLPGALPVLNAKAVSHAIRLGLALDCRLNTRSVFARKSYFYPDLPRNYQITQYAAPICRDGALDIGPSPEPKPVGLERIHLEEDAGKSIHRRDGTLVDLNRAGTPLLEIVTRPEIATPEEACAFIRRLRRLLRYLGICDGDMEKGNLRCDANISVRRRGETRLGVRTEIKNLNSINGLRRGLIAETGRQAGILAEGGIVREVTLAWDTAANRTRMLRQKEAARDYRYFPEPDLPPLVLTEEEIEAERADLPELPDARERRFASMPGVTPQTAALLAETPRRADYFDAVAAASEQPRLAANWICTEILSVAGEAPDRGFGMPIAPDALAELLRMIASGRLSGPQAKAVFARMAGTGDRAEAAISDLGVGPALDAEDLAETARALVAGHPEQAAAWRSGRTRVLGWFMGEMMRRTGGRVQPQKAESALIDALSSGLSKH